MTVVIQDRQIVEVVKSGQRPDLNVITGQETLVKLIRDCISSCWDQLPERRPTFAGIYACCFYSAL